tara:strand:+ start:47 stop:856 length:810 start_codon:yes stop_codon:yes gene_type:complete
MASGSSLINTSAQGQPADQEDRPFSFAMGTQIFLNPIDDPVDSVVSFKVNPDLLVGGLTNVQSNLSIGFSTDSELDSLSSWDATFISSISANRFPVGFGCLLSNTSKVGVNVQGVQVATIAKSQVVSVVNASSNEFTITAHPFNTGDRVLVSSTGAVPGNISSAYSYFVINSSANSIKLSSTLLGAQSSSEVSLDSVGSGTITVASDEIFTLTRNGISGTVTLKKASATIGTFTTTNVDSPLRLFYWNREQSGSSTDPVLKEIKVTGAI